MMDGDPGDIVMMDGDPGDVVKPMTVIDQLDSLRSQLAMLAGWFNQRGAFDAALKTQVALVAINDISGASDADFEESFP